MASKTEICNLALGHLGQSLTIANVDTEAGKVPAAFRRVYEIELKTMMESFPWPFATKFVTLGLVEEEPTDEWDYSYRMPSDCLQFRRIMSGVRNDTRATRVPYKIGQDTQGDLIYTDEVDAECEYTVRVTDENRYPSSFRKALALALALAMLPQMVKGKGDPSKLGAFLRSEYKVALSVARANAANEEQPDEPPDTESVEARGGF